MKRFVAILIVVGALSLTVSATPIFWTLQSVSFDDTGTASGNFTYDADAGANGTYSSINITTTAGSSLPGTTYTFFCDGVVNCTGLVPNSTEVLFLNTDPSLSLTGTLGLAFGFNSALTDAGGVVSLGGFIEGTCTDKVCSSETTPERNLVSGDVSGQAPPVPEPSTLLLAGTAALAFGFRRLRKQA